MFKFIKNVLSSTAKIDREKDQILEDINAVYPTNVTEVHKYLNPPYSFKVEVSCSENRRNNFLLDFDPESPIQLCKYKCHHCGGMINLTTKEMYLKEYFSEMTFHKTLKHPINQLFGTLIGEHEISLKEICTDKVRDFSD